MNLISFADFLTRLNEEESLAIYSEVPFPNFAYEKLLGLFHTYCLIGGIPDIVETYSLKRDLKVLKPVYERYLDGLFSRAGELAHTSVTRERIRIIYQDSFAYAAMRITFRGFSRQDHRSRDTAKVFRLLESAGLLKLIYPVTHASLPWKVDYSRAPRLHLPDTGLVNYFTGIQRPLTGLSDLSSVFNRQIALHITAQVLLYSERREDHPVHFWVRSKTQSTAEVDFVIGYEDLMIPVEVKSGEPGRLRSLHQFVDSAPHPFAVRLYAGPLYVKETKTMRGKKYFLMSLPYFLSGKIREHLEGFIKFVSW
jgi:predicted AAA+ superfamily ATPase